MPISFAGTGTSTNSDEKSTVLLEVMQVAQTTGPWIEVRECHALWYIHNAQHSLMWFTGLSLNLQPPLAILSLWYPAIYCTTEDDGSHLGKFTATTPSQPWPWLAAIWHAEIQLGSQMPEQLQWARRASVMEGMRTQITVSCPCRLALWNGLPPPMLSAGNASA